MYSHSVFSIITVFFVGLDFPVMPNLDSSTTDDLIDWYVKTNSEDIPLIFPSSFLDPASLIFTYTEIVNDPTEINDWFKVLVSGQNIGSHS